ncbi:MAG: diaminopimelate decarboxylase [Chloroflexota bacterium]
MPETGAEPAAGTGADAAADRLPDIAPALRRAAARFGTPLYLTDVASVDAAAAAVRAAFPNPWIRSYSVKANDVAGVVGLVGERGFGANVVSRGEWAVATRAGIPNDRITFEGVGKSDGDLRAAVAVARDGRPLRWLAIESVDEAVALATLAAAARMPPLDVLFRLNPDVTPETKRGLAVGAGSSKFGMTETELSAAIDAVSRAGSALRPRGIHLHVGSQLGAVDAWRDAVRRGLALLALLRGSIPRFDTLDTGGGFPVAGLADRVPAPALFAREVQPLIDQIPADRRPKRLAIEPGRYLVARAGWLVGRVLHVRERGGPLVVADVGMAELIRPALYGARHDIVALTSLGRPVNGGDPAAATATTVEGPICESTDELGVHDLPLLARGDVVAIRDAGAYGASQSSTYNGRPRPPQVLLETDGRLVVSRRRGSAASLG